MHPRVRTLYKELICAATHYSIAPVAVARGRIKAAFAANALLEPGTAEWKRALAWGRHEVRNMQAQHEIKQFRALRGRYENEASANTFATPWSELTRPSLSPSSCDSTEADGSASAPA